MNLYQPTITGSLSVSGSVNISGSITIAGGGTISGTASLATTASYAVSASNAVAATTASFVALAQSATNAITASSADNFLVRNTLTAQTLVVQTITSSVDFVTGSTRFGSLSANTHVFTGSMYVTGAFYVTTGSVGIGTTNPGAKLSVIDNINSYGVIRIQNSSISGYSAIEVFDSSSSQVGAIGYANVSASVTAGNMYTYSTGNITFLAGGTTERMRITSAGNVGIGATPSSWTSFTAVEGPNGNFAVTSGASLWLTANVYYNSGWKYINTGASAAISAGGTGISFCADASGTANASNAQTSRMFISSSGNVGIGTSAPTAISGFTSVCINNTTTGGFFEAQQGGTVLTRFGGQSDLAFIDTVANIPFILKTNSTERFRISSTGLVGIGTNNPTSPLTVKSTSRTDTLRLSISGSSSTGETTGITFGSSTYDKAQITAYNENSGNAAGYLAFWTGGSPATTDMTERMRIKSDGNVKIGDQNSTVTATLAVSRDMAWPSDVSPAHMALCGVTDSRKRLVLGYDTTNNYGFIGSGQLGVTWTDLKLNPTSGAVYAGSTRLDNLSDARVKNNIHPITGALNKVLLMNGKKFHLLDEPESKIRLGFVAQELQGVVDELVVESDRTQKLPSGEVIENVLSLETWGSSWAALLVEAIKEQNQTIILLQQQINTLLNK